MKKSKYVTIMIRIILVLVLSFELTTYASAQIIDKRKAGVYLEFKDLIHNDSKKKDEVVGVRLVFRNNTRWPVFYVKLSESSLAPDVPMSYIIEKDNGCREERLKIDVIFRSKLMPGKSVSFKVPKEDFISGHKIYVAFAFSWEKPLGKEIHPDESTHRAYFSTFDLDKKAK